MKKVLFLLIYILGSFAMWAQDINLDKATGLVKVDGKESFFLVAKNKKVVVSDFALENLDREELAYLKYVDYGNNGAYQMVFTTSGNQCFIHETGAFGVARQLAKIIASANLVQGGRMSEAAERKFITLYNGTFVNAAPAPEPVIAATDSRTAAAQPADISIKGTKIYNNSEWTGFFKTEKDGDNTVISVYNASDALICTATHPDGKDDEDWTLLLDGKTVNLLYNTADPYARLFKYLVEKGYL